MKKTTIAAAMLAAAAMPSIADAQSYYARQLLTKVADAQPAPSPTPTPTPSPTPTPTPTPAPVDRNLSSSITITAGIASNCIQVAEVEVYAGGVNVAAAANGGSASGSGTYSYQSTPDKAIDGIKPSSYPNIYHSVCSPGDYLTITFARPVTVDRVVVFGRQDYGPERDYYGYSLSGSGATGFVDARNGSGQATPQY